MIASMRVFAIGDIHGCLIAFETLLDVVGPNSDDLIVTLGDYVDRGLDTAGVLDRLIRLQETHQLVALRGNHDSMMLNAAVDVGELEVWCAMGGQSTLDSYPGSRLRNVPEDHWWFLRDYCIDWHETQTHLFVHGHVEPDLAMKHQSVATLHWKKIYDCQPHSSGKTVICGHTRQRDGLPLDLGHTICIDTGPANGGWLTCLEVDTGKIWQTDEAGGSRAMHRGDLATGSGS